MCLGATDLLLNMFQSYASQSAAYLLEKLLHLALKSDLFTNLYIHAQL